eukprot:CAMPEP_0182918834 /NCGR_PEP_ID=MMETSP0105_2-20130417/2326_1 /TAXON_ID=81532 ORGANISM="Acanthoeca-like sp., Strain 10tr" /NCGR_SAMPLE_ID=MMETSP0105_2 /ASSEMBLY_ACC=CAM_ASM_000205 /LENGTH=85 /DNA_ID=CAMNT_0025055953 /DNA_START=681 /DNA_END=938 /DNA_ORIENTATION=+
MSAASGPLPAERCTKLLDRGLSAGASPSPIASVGSSQKSRGPPSSIKLFDLGLRTQDRCGRLDSSGAAAAAAAVLSEAGNSAIAM